MLTYGWYSLTMQRRRGPRGRPPAAARSSWQGWAAPWASGPAPPASCSAWRRASRTRCGQPNRFFITLLVSVFSLEARTKDRVRTTVDSNPMRCRCFPGRNCAPLSMLGTLLLWMRTKCARPSEGSPARNRQALTQTCSQSFRWTSSHQYIVLPLPCDRRRRPGGRRPW
jgi:hypothetical protein